MDIVDRLHQQLLSAIERGAAGPGALAPTIGEVYQHLVPYRAMRGELGVWELAEYEHALLRLLAGERDYLQVERDEVRDELRRELASPNPILGIYRDYATVRVQVRDAAPPPAPGDAPEASLPEPEPSAAAPVAAACRACGSTLPEVPGLRFCPACGDDQLVARCSRCDAPLKEEWNFCIRCGTPRGGGEPRERPDR